MIKMMSYTQSFLLYFGWIFALRLVRDPRKPIWQRFFGACLLAVLAFLLSWISTSFPRTLNYVPVVLNWLSSQGLTISTQIYQIAGYVVLTLLYGAILPLGMRLGRVLETLDD